MIERLEAAPAAPGSINACDPPLSFERIIDPEPLGAQAPRWTWYAGPAVSLLILAATVYQLRTIDLHKLWQLRPTSLTFAAALLVYYFANPAAEWVIFRRLWRLPIEGVPALLRKLVSNELLLGYLGELYFYSWARSNARIKAAPFGAIKDVAILSALTGNLFTLLMVLLAAPLFGALHLPVAGHTFATSASVVLVSSLAMMLLRKRLFTLPPKELWFVGAVHSVRIVAAIVFAALMWHALLPAVALKWWVLLATIRQLLSRLPLVPNKDLVFAGLAAALMGVDSDIAEAVTMSATLILALHLIVGSMLGVAGLARAGASD